MRWDEGRCQCAYAECDTRRRGMRGLLVAFGDGGGSSVLVCEAPPPPPPANGAAPRSRGSTAQLEFMHLFALLSRCQ